MDFIVATKGAILFLNEEGQLMDNRMRGFILVGIPEHGKIFRIFMVRIAWKNLISLVGRMDIKDKNTIFIKSIIDFFEDVSHFYFVLHVADGIGIAGHKVVGPCLGQIQHIALDKINLLLG